MTALFIILPLILLAAGIIALVYFAGKTDAKAATNVAYTQGIIIKATQDSATIRYTVKEQTYELVEKLAMKEAAQGDQLTVGTKVPVTPVEVGRTVIIQYNTKEPTKAFWVANTQSQT